MKKIPSTKFWTMIFGMLCATVVQCWLLYMNNTEYVESYMILIGAAIGLHNGLKTLQNRLLSDNGGKS